MLQYHVCEDYFIIRLHLIPLISGQRDEKFSWQFSHAPTKHSLGTIWGKSNLEACFFSLNRDLLCSAPPDCSLVLPHLFRSTRFRSALVHIALHLIVYTGPVHGMLLWTCDQHASLFFSDLPILLPDLLHVLSELPRQLNFIEHTSDIGWKE